MKILLIHNFYQYWGGEDTYAISLKKLLEENGHAVYLYSKDSKNIKTAWDKIKAAIGLFYNPRVKKELTKIIKEFKPDVSHFHNLYSLIGATSYRVCKENKIPVIQHIHNYRFMCPKGILFRKGKICELCLHKKLPFYSIFFGCYHQSRLASLYFSLAFFYHHLIKTFDLIDKFIFPSEFTRDYYLKYLKIPKNKTHHLPYFVDIKKGNLKKVKKEDYFLFVGRLSEEKGIIQLLEIFKTLPEIDLIVIGDGPLRKEVGQYIKYKNIKILGFLKRDQIYEYMRRSKTIIISSIWYEVLPIVYIEALVNGTGVICPRSDNFKKIVKNHQRNNYELGDFNDLKKKIIFLEQKHHQQPLQITNQLIYSKKNHLNNIVEHYKN